jgi:hypothetical protein
LYIVAGRKAPVLKRDDHFSAATVAPQIADIDCMNHQQIGVFLVKASQQLRSFHEQHLDSLTVKLTAK